MQNFETIGQLQWIYYGRIVLNEWVSDGFSIWRNPYPHPPLTTHHTPHTTPHPPHTTTTNPPRVSWLFIQYPFLIHDKKKLHGFASQSFIVRRIHGWIPLAKGQFCGNSFHAIASSWIRQIIHGAYWYITVLGGVSVLMSFVISVIRILMPRRIIKITHGYQHHYDVITFAGLGIALKLSVKKWFSSKSSGYQIPTAVFKRRLDGYSLVNVLHTYIYIYNICVCVCLSVCLRMSVCSRVLHKDVMWHEHMFRVVGPLWGESMYHRWFILTNGGISRDIRRRDAHVMSL